MRYRMNVRLLIALALGGLLGLGTGCGTIRGNPPKLGGSPGSLRTVSPPQPPAPLSTSHLKKRIEPAPQATNLLNVSVQPEHPNIIFYPRLRLETEDEVVRTSPVSKGDLTMRSEKLLEIVGGLKTNERSFLAVIDLKNESAQAGASGRLAADFLYRALVRQAREQKLQFRIIDRENAWSFVREEARAMTNVFTSAELSMIDVSEEEMMKLAKKLQFATCWLSGAVTTFSLENKELEFKYRLEEKSLADFTTKMDAWTRDYRQYQQRYRTVYAAEYQRYVDDFQDREAENERNYASYVEGYDRYMEQEYRKYDQAYNRYVEDVRRTAALGNFLFLPLHLGLEIISLGNADTWAKPRPYPQTPAPVRSPRPSLGTVAIRADELDLSNVLPTRYNEAAVLTVMSQIGMLPLPQRRMATVCNVGITVRLVDGKSSDIMWIANGTTRNTDLQIGMEDVCTHVISNFFEAIQRDGTSSL